MKLTDKKEMSHWAYVQCKKGNDTEEMRNLITDQYIAYLYCRYIKDRDNIRSLIIDSEYAFWYCHNIKDSPEVRKYITDEQDLKFLEKREIKNDIIR